MMRFAVLLIAALSSVTPAFAQTIEIPSSFDQLTDAAQREGSIDLVWSESILGGGDVAKQHEAEFNRLFKTKIRFNFAPGVEMARLGNQLFTELQANQPASSDVYIAAAPQMLPLLKRDIFRTIPWQKLMPDRIVAREVEEDSRMLRVQTALSGFTYNTELIKTPPTSLAEFLKPEWKGRIASTPYAAGFDVLAANDLWGPERTIDFVRKLSSQVSGLIRCGDVERIATGEFQALVMDCISNTTDAWRERDAPVGYAIAKDAAQKRYYYIGIPRHARHPNAAALFSLYLVTPEGQALMWKTSKTDLDGFGGSHMAEKISENEAKGVKFSEITIAWWNQHPEIDQAKTEMIKALTTK
jgi:ABC-type Fe3+ transport system substrate-binding protein